MESRDSNEDILFSVVGEDQANTSIYVDSVFESREIEDGCEKIAFGCEEQVVIMLAPTELRFPASDDEDSCSGILENGEILINNEKEGQVEAISDEVIEVVVEELEVEDNMDYEKATNIITIEDDVAENEDTVFMNATTEVACADEVKVKEEKQADDYEDGDDMIPENCEGDLSSKTCSENPILREDDHQQTQCNKKQLLIGGEEEVKADCVDVVNIEEDIQVNEVRETTPIQLINEDEEEKEEVQERVTTKEDELLNKIEIEIPQTQVIEATKVDDNETAVVLVVREEDSPRQLTNKQEKIEMIVDDEIPLIQPIVEDEAKKSNDEKDTSDHTYNNNGIKQDEYKLGGSKSELWRWSILVLLGNGDTYKTFIRVIAQRKNRITHFPPSDLMYKFNISD